MCNFPIYFFRIYKSKQHTSIEVYSPVLKVTRKACISYMCPVSVGFLSQFLPRCFWECCIPADSLLTQSKVTAYSDSVIWLALVAAKLKSGAASQLASPQGEALLQAAWNVVHHPFLHTDNSISFHGYGSEMPFSNEVLSFSFSKILRKVSGVVKKLECFKTKREKKKCILLPCWVIQCKLQEKCIFKPESHTAGQNQLELERF